MREKIKEIFLNSNHQFISGEELSRQLQISRTAIWKQIEELKKEGYEFEAIRKKGYRLMNNPDDIHAEQIKKLLTTIWLGKNTVYFKELESTQQKAHLLAKDGAEHGTVILTNDQTKGKGRLGRTWYAEKGKGIWLSMILRPSFGYQLAPTITLVTALSIVETLEKLYGIKASIKWPNDVFIDGKKCAGILTEIHGEQDQIHYLIIGIGINTHKMEFVSRSEIEKIVISLEEKINQTPKRNELIIKLLEIFENNFERFVKEGFNPFFPLYNERLYGKGRKITVNQFAQRIEGTIIEVDPQGYLLLETDDRKIIKITSGDIQV